MSKLTKEQKELLEAIPQKLRREAALAYVASGMENQTRAYITACKKIKRAPSKNPETSASEILNYPNVVEFLDSIRKPKVEAAAENAVGTFEQKKAMLWDVANRCSQYRPVTDAKGNQVFVSIKNEHGEDEMAAAYTFEHKGVVSAISELNKMDGDHAAQRVELGATEDLVHLIQQGRARALKNDSDN